MGGSLLLILLILGALSYRSGARRDASLLAAAKSKTPEENLTFLVKYMRAAQLLPAQLMESWEGQPLQEETPKKPEGSIATRMFFILGALFLFAGISVCISGFWDSMGPALRILLTLGVGSGLFYYYVTIIRQGKQEGLIVPLFIMSLVLQPFGLLVLQNEIVSALKPANAAMVMCVVMTAQYWITWKMLRRGWVLFFAIGFSFAAAHLLLNVIGVPDKYSAVLVGGTLFAVAYRLVKFVPENFADVLLFISIIWFETGFFMIAMEAVNATVVTREAIVSLLCGITLLLFAYPLRKIRRFPMALLSYLLGTTAICTGVFIVITSHWGVSATDMALIATGAILFMLVFILRRFEDTSLVIIGYLASTFMISGGIYQIVVEHYSQPLALMLAGLSLSSAAYGFKRAKLLPLADLELFIGSCAFYHGLFGMVQHTPLEVLHLGVSLSLVYVSVRLQSTPLLITSVLAILGFIGYYTAMYFVHSAGWPIALMFMGLTFIGIGNMALKIKRRYDM